tara:strand:+ start:49 stop:1131 length:1083 start_codon:yes stop_codon:yes gene_type:complete
MKIYSAAIIGLGPSGLAVNKLIYNNQDNEIIAFEKTNIEKRNNFFGFWLTEWMMPFEKLIEKKWNNWVISDVNSEVTHCDKKYPYCVISFKKWKDYCLNTNNKLEVINETVTKYYSKKNYFEIVTKDNKKYFARKVYDSRYNKEKKNELIQHFFGINILTTNNDFNENKLNLMHFTEEDNLLHFIYLLPFSKNKALVESTVFSKKVLSEEWYRNKITKYLNYLKINKYKELSQEKGVIPMFFSEEKTSKNLNIYNIGIRGGACKPSTGYAFAFLIKQIQLLKDSKKNHIHIHNYIEKKMDKVFLNYLKSNNENGISFINLAKNLNGREFQNFMMGYSSILTKIKIIKSMPKLAFIKAIFK